MIYFAIDQSSNVSGYSVWKDKELIEWGKVQFEGEFVFRVIELKKWIFSKIEEFDEDEVEVIIEEIQEQTNAQTFKKLAMLQGAILVALTEAEIKYHLVYAAQWKSFVSIKSNNRAEQKRDAQRYVLEKYGKKVTQDEADAICMGEYIVFGIKNWGR
jgi:Holliday junction resolvasome RuvABC endonuclease subunit